MAIQSVTVLAHQAVSHVPEAEAATETSALKVIEVGYAVLQGYRRCKPCKELALYEIDQALHLLQGDANAVPEGMNDVRYGFGYRSGWVRSVHRRSLGD